MHDIYKESLALHKQHQGKYEIRSKIPLNNFHDLSLAYSPGVAEPCKHIARDTQTVYDYTSKGNTIAVISDGSAVLGLGNIGPYAALPVMEGKSILFKNFANINAIALCLNTQETEKIIETCKILEPSLGGINLEDIAAPRCFEIEERLNQELNIPVFHDDQHGTAIVVAAAIINANRLTGRNPVDLKVVVSGLGAAGVAICTMLHHLGIRHITAFNSQGAVHKQQSNSPIITQLLIQGVIQDQPDKTTLTEALVDSNVFIGVSVGNIVTKEMVQGMQKDAYVFALANPEPEIMPDIALAAGALVVGTGRSDFDNQINNVLAFPGIFHGVLQAKATRVTTQMKLAAAKAIAEIISEEELSSTYIIPKVFDKRVVPAVSKAIVNNALST